MRRPIRKSRISQLQLLKQLRALGAQLNRRRGERIRTQRRKQGRERPAQRESEA